MATRVASCLPTLRVFGVYFGPSLSLTMTPSWLATSQAARAALNPWRGQGVANLNFCRDILETFIFSKLWYLAQILPLPNQVCQQLTAMAGSFLWAGHLERITWQKLHSPKLEVALQVSCLASRAQALLSKQIC